MIDDKGKRQMKIEDAGGGMFASLKEEPELGAKRFSGTIPKRKRSAESERKKFGGERRRKKTDKLFPVLFFYLAVTIWRE